jgi:hypothetical protein
MVAGSTEVQRLDYHGAENPKVSFVNRLAANAHAADQYISAASDKPLPCVRFTSTARGLRRASADAS